MLEFSRDTEAIGDIDIDKEIYYKELAHVIMGADRSQDLQLANWRPRRAGGRVPGTWEPGEQRPEGLKHMKSWCFSSSLKMKTNVLAQGHCVVRQKEIPRYLKYFFYAGPQLTGWGPPTWGRVIHFALSTHSNVNFIQKHLEWCLTKYLCSPWPHQIDT